MKHDTQGQLRYNRPSVALILGNLLINCCQLKKGMAIRRQDNDKLLEADRFLSLFNSEWSDSISCPALAALKTSHYNKAEELPSTDDLMKLKKFTDTQLNTWSDALKQNSDYKTWRSLAEVALTKLIVFNKRRANEPAKLELAEYVHRPNWQATSNKELIANLQPLERKLMEKMDLVQIQGKRNRKVPIVITPEVKQAMDLLMKTLNNCRVPSGNKYFFASDSPNGHFNSWLVLHNNAVAADVDKPRLITSCRLRKYVATLAQVTISRFPFSFHSCVETRLWILF